MIGQAEQFTPDTKICWFGFRRLSPLLDAFRKEIAGVEAAEDIEYVHRMRVASRRLRAAFPLFQECFSGKEYVRWRKEIAVITRALGEARDADVQIAFMMQCRKASPLCRDRMDRLGPAIAFLLRNLRKRRQALQKRVLSALKELEKEDVVGEMQETFARRIATGQRDYVKSLAYGIPTVAALRIGSRLDAMLSFEPFVTQADAVAEHHAMRIAAKKLRYTMEVYGPVYRLGLAKPHARAKKVQEYLGDLHDCDVWIDQVSRLLLRERERLRSKGHVAGPDTATLQSLRLFLQERMAERIRLHHRFIRYWQSLARERVWDDLRYTLAAGRRKHFIPVHAWKEEELRTAADNLAATFPQGLMHHRTVTRLALMLFDQLQSLHEFSLRDRALLECAGMLHDIGWPDNSSKGHGTRSAYRIFSTQALPLDLPDRCIVGLAALAHRGKVRIESHPLFLLLGPEEQKKALMLAALIRIADGLDVLHAGSVQEVRCIFGGQDVVCEAIAPGNITCEKKRAQTRSDLFTRVCGRGFLVR